MKIKEKKSPKFSRPILIAAMGLILALSGLLFYLYVMSGSGSDNKVNLRPATKEQKNAATQAKNDFLSNSGSKTDTSPVNDARVIISSASQNKDTKNLHVEAIVQLARATGTCTLTAKKDSASVERTVSTIPQSNFTACADFDIPVTELSPGTWTVTVVYTDDSHSGSQTQNVNIE